MVHIDPSHRLLLRTDWRMGVAAGGKPGLFDQVQKKLVPVVFRRVSRHDKLVGVQPGWDIVGLAGAAAMGASEGFMDPIVYPGLNVFSIF